MSIGDLSDFHKNASFIKGFYPPPTVYVNSHYIANHYREQVLSSKHYYMGSMRFASALVSSPYRPPGWGEPAPGEEGEGPIEVEAGYSQESDGVIQDIASTLACLNGLEEIQVEMSSFNLQSLGEVMELLPCEELLPQDYPEELCNCEQDLYTAELIGYDCNLVNILYFYHPDYLGSVEYISDMRGEAYQFFLNTPWGENLENQFSKSYTSFSSRFRFNGKEWDEETGNFYYGARYYDPKISVWLSVDPLAHQFPSWSSYSFSYNNPLRFVDPDGMSAGDYIDENGNKIGDDGIPDGKVYLIKTTETEFDGGGKSGGISEAEKAEAISFVKKNSGDCWAFETEEGQKAKGSFIDVSISKETRSSMYGIVKKDSGGGSTGDANNREYGGYVKPDGTVVEMGPGPVNDLKKTKGRNVASLEYTVENEKDVAYRFHSHPSG
ncbi:MAG: RHS repeat-associated core domain-containing protein [Bacteroidetes bacterium]|nr:RHS repeat-associated core domain-containing protein [Bacteroidota bacterium]